MGMPLQFVSHTLSVRALSVVAGGIGGPGGETERPSPTIERDRDDERLSNATPSRIRR